MVLRRVAIDCRVLQEPLNRYRGLGRYCDALLCGLGTVCTGDRFEFGYLQYRSNQWLSRSYPVPARCFGALGSLGTQGHLINPLIDLAFKSIYRTRWGMDVFHLVEPFSHFPLYQHRNTKLVVTVHDLIPLRMRRELLQGSASGRVRSVAVRCAMSTLRRADAIIAVSHQTRRELLRMLRVDPRKLHVVHEAVDTSVFRHESGMHESESLLRRLGVERRRFVMHVGDVGDRKDSQTLLRAFALAGRALPALRLVMVGKTAANRRLPSARAFWRHVERMGLQDRVRVSGFVQTPDLARLYRSALALVFPSRMEGFGLPVLEAMHCGCPVVACRLPVFVELIGHSDGLVDMGNAAGLGDEIVRLAQDAKAFERRRTWGLERSRRFSRENMARQTLDVYRSVLGIPQTPETYGSSLAEERVGATGSLTASAIVCDPTQHTGGQAASGTRHESKGL